MTQQSDRERLENTFPLRTFPLETKRQLVEFVLQEIAEARIEEIEDIDQSRDIEEEVGGIIWCTSCEMTLEDPDQKCGCNNIYDKRKQRISMLRHQANKLSKGE